MGLQKKATVCLLLLVFAVAGAALWMRIKPEKAVSDIIDTPLEAYIINDATKDLYKKDFPKNSNGAMFTFEPVEGAALESLTELLALLVPTDEPVPPKYNRGLSYTELLLKGSGGCYALDLIAAGSGYANGSDDYPQTDRFLLSQIGPGPDHVGYEKWWCEARDANKALALINNLSAYTNGGDGRMFWYQIFEVWGYR